MSNYNSNLSFGLKFDSDENSSQGDGSQYGTETAAAMIGSLLGGQKGIVNSSLKRTPDGQPSDGGAESESNKKKKPLTLERREDRNLREKERSLKITQQIHELRDLLSMGGVIVPKGTKSTILTEASNYIRLLQQQVYRLEVEKATLVQEVQRIGSSSHHAAIQQVAPQSVVSSANTDVVALASDPSSSGDNEYRCVFNSCSVGMAVATMGGSFIDCNPAFTQLSKFTKQELQAMTIFNITSRDDLQGAFDMMSQLITPSPGGLDADGNTVEEGKAQAPVVLRSGFRHRNDLGLSVSLIRGDDGVARNFNVTLVKLPPSPLGGLMPVPATADTSPIMNVVPQQQQQQQQQVSSMIPLQQISQQGQVDNKQNYLGLHAPQFTAG